MTIKQMEKKDAIKYLTNQLLNLYSYFGNNVGIDDNLIRQVQTLQEDLEVYHSLTTDQLEEALKFGRRNASDSFKPSIRLIIQWVSQYMVRFNKSHQTIHQLPAAQTEQKKYDINYSMAQRKAWIISSYRQYHENNRDMAKFFDFGAVTYEAIYVHHSYGLLKEQKEYCFEMASRLNLTIMLGSLASRTGDPTDFRNNASACAYACKLFFDQFPTESDLRTELMYHEPVSKDHFVAAYEKTPLLVNYFEKRNQPFQK